LLRLDWELRQHILPTVSPDLAMSTISGEIPNFGVPGKGTGIQRNGCRRRKRIPGGD
jgi:hypothetical protein